MSWALSVKDAMHTYMLCYLPRGISYAAYDDMFACVVKDKNPVDAVSKFESKNIEHGYYVHKVVELDVSPVADSTMSVMVPAREWSREALDTRREEIFIEHDLL